MELNNLITQCSDTLKEDVRQAILARLDHAGVTVNTNDGYIDIWYDRDEKLNAAVYHDGNDHDSVNLEAFITEHLSKELNWLQIEQKVHDEIDSCNVWNMHGFADAADYWQWKGY